MTGERGERADERSRHVTRRSLLTAAGVGLAGTVAGRAGALVADDSEPAGGSTRYPTPDHPLDRSPGSTFAPHDGFATADWFGDDVDVYRVTNTSSSGVGSLRWAVNRPGPRVVVFETSGTIDLERDRLTVQRDKCWIAGQTAPSPGVTLTRGDFWLDADDCVVQHLRVRPGDAGENSGWEPDGVRTADGTENNVFDHCSISWSVDENASPGYDATDTTFANCIVAEPLHVSTHSKGPHGYGMLVGDNSTGNAILGNLFAHNVRRTPRLKSGTEAAVVNNVFYHMETGTNMDFDGTYSIVGNHYRRGSSERLINGSARGDQRPNVYIADNTATFDAEITNGQMNQLDSPRAWPDGLTALRSGETTEHATVHAGARPADRTEHDERVVRHVRDGTGTIVDSQDDVGGYPDLAENDRSLSVPDEGLGDWLYEHTRTVERDVSDYVDDETGSLVDLLDALRDRETGTADATLVRRVARAVSTPGGSYWA